MNLFLHYPSNGKSKGGGRIIRATCCIVMQAMTATVGLTDLAFYITYINDNCCCRVYTCIY